MRYITQRCVILNCNKPATHTGRMTICTGQDDSFERQTTIVPVCKNHSKRSDLIDVKPIEKSF